MIKILFVCHGNICRSPWTAPLKEGATIHSVPAPANHHRGSYTSPALAAASYPFVDLPPGNTLRCKLFPFSKFYNRPLYFSETMKYNEVNDKLEVVEVLVWDYLIS